MYAQTNIQLFRELRREGYSAAEQCVIRNAYDLATEVFTGYFTAASRTQIAHVVGTASILCSLHVPAEVVAAGLIHNAYDTGDFGDGRRGVTDPRRRHVRGVVGARVEEYVCRFPATKSAAHSGSTRVHPNALSEAPDPIDRHLLLIVVADTLEHALNCEDASPRRALMAERAAERLGFPALAAEVRRAFGPAAVGELLTELAVNGHRRARVMAPRSYRRRLSIVVREALADVVRRWRSSFAIKRALGHLVERISRRRVGAAAPSDVPVAAEERPRH